MPESQSLYAPKASGAKGYLESPHVKLEASSWESTWSRTVGQRRRNTPLSPCGDCTCEYTMTDSTADTASHKIKGQGTAPHSWELQAVTTLQMAKDWRLP
jgi:hypothetical protein